MLLNLGPLFHSRPYYRILLEASFPDSEKSIIWYKLLLLYLIFSKFLEQIFTHSLLKWF